MNSTFSSGNISATAGHRKLSRALLMAFFACHFAIAQVLAVPWVSRHDMSAADYQTEFNTWTGDPYNYRLISVCGYEAGGQARFAAIWEQRAGPAWITHPQMTQAQLDSFNTTYAAQDYHPVFISGFDVGGQAYYNAIWEYLPGADIVPKAGLTSTALAAENRARTSQGYTLVHLWALNAGPTEYFAAIWRKGVSEKYQVRYGLSAADYQLAFNDLSGQGFQLISVSTSMASGQEHYAGVWKNPGDGTIWYSTHDLSSGNYQAETWNWYYQGYRPVFVSAFVRNSAARLNSIWYYNGGITPANMQAIDNAVSSYMSTSGVPGVSLAISRQGRLVYAKGFGYGDVAAGELVHPHNRFRIASVSKTITAAAVLKLRDHCGLDLDQAVFGPGAILDEVYGTPPYSARERAITVRHLLNHTTGWTDDGIWNVASSDPNEVVSWQLDNTEPASPPGTSYQYMNADFCTAGRVVEMRSGRTYEQFVKDEILAPSCITDMEIGGSTLAERKPGEVVYYGGNPYGLNLSRMDANGGWIARPIDLLLFLRRIDSNTNQAEILQSGSLTQMRTPSGTPGQGMGYGFGLVVNPSGGPFGNNEWGHNGAMDGTTAFLVYRTDGMAFAFACNNWPADWAGNLRQIIDNLITTLSAANAWPNYDLFPCDVPPGDPPVQMEVAKNVYVDGSSSCIFQNGHKDCIFGGPFSMVTQGFNGAPCSGDHLFIRAGSYNETIVLNRRMTLQSYDGVAVIGK